MAERKKQQQKERARDKHRRRHALLHGALDELAADYLSHGGKLLSNTTVMELMKWSHKQTTDPEDPE